MRRFALLAVLAFLCAGAAAEEELKHSTDALKDIKKSVDEGKAVLIDVREIDEWEEQHVKEARFVPMSKIDEKGKLPAEVPKDKPVYVHCAVGGRALTVAKILKKLGYDARPITAGPAQLIKAGFEPVKKADK